MSDSRSSETSLGGMLLVAMPGMPDPRFAHSVIYLCTYSSDGAMGLIINQIAEEVDFGEIVGQLDIEIFQRCGRDAGTCGRTCRDWAWFRPALQ